MTGREKGLTELADEILAYLKSFDDQTLQRFIDKWPEKELRFRPIRERELPVQSYFPEIMAGTTRRTEHLVKTFWANSKCIFWVQTYDERDFGNDFLMRYGGAEVIGYRGPIISDDMTCGCLLLGPENTYPPHNHEPHEVYIPLSGKTTLWREGDADWETRPVGLPIYHAPWVVHSVKTTSEPLLALYVWVGGDLTRKSTIQPAREKGEG